MASGRLEERLVNVLTSRRAPESEDPLRQRQHSYLRVERVGHAGCLWHRQRRAR